MGRTRPVAEARLHAVRTCVGCRQRTTKSDLLRVVLARDGATPWLVPDISGRAPGRGAHLHPTRKCLELAERRRAFPRALRAEGAIDTTALRRHVEEQDQTATSQSPAMATEPAPARQKAGRAAHEHSMRTER